jgi:hypothetical protein
MAEKSDVISTGGVTGGLPARGPWMLNAKRMRILQLHSKGWHPYVENKARDAATAARSGGRGPAALDSVCA